MVPTTKKCRLSQALAFAAQLSSLRKEYELIVYANGNPRGAQQPPRARRLAASGRPSATSGVIAVGTLRPYHIWCNWLRWPSASYTELVTQVVAGQVLEHVHRLALLVPVAEVDRADCFCELDRSGV